MADDDFFAEFDLSDKKKEAVPAAAPKTSGGSQMAAEIEEKIRSLPGNDTCADCSNISPQWATVTYGTLICLECSGQHRSMGVHLSFVRSVQMDSWTDKQLNAMQKSGGNKALVDFFISKGIAQDMQIAKKYGTPQAAYFKDRLSRWLEGKTEPPADPGQYDPETGGGDAQGAEPLPGETTEEYNARQGRLKEQARERMRAKFGQGGMSGMGSEEPPSADGPDVGAAASAAAAKAADASRAAAGAISGAASSSLGFLKSNVIENTELHSKVKDTTSGAIDATKGAASAVAGKASGLWKSVSQQVSDGSMTETLKKNATVEEGSGVHKAWGWGMGAATSIWAKASETVGDAISGTQKPCTGDHQLTVDPRTDVKCDLCRATGTRYACSRGCEYYVCPKCFEKPPASKSKAADDDGGWGDFEEEEKPAPAEVTADDMARIAKELGMNVKAEESAAAAPEPKPKPKPKPKAEEVDFFADFN